MADAPGADKALLARASRSIRRYGDGEVDIAAVLSTRDLVGPPAKETAGLAREALDLLDGGLRLDARQRQALELAIRALRPFVLVRGGLLDDLPIEAAVIFDEWEPFRHGVQPLTRSIGKIMRKASSGQAKDIGTGFLVGPGHLLTNHHVLRALCEGTDALVSGVATVGFAQEYEGSEPGPVEITGVAAVHPVLDAAVLVVADGGGAGPPIAVPTDPVELSDGEPLAVVGFPLSSAERTLSISMLDSTAKGKKRGSPGEVLGGADDTIDHDCSTMPGSSGSPVFRMRDGGLVALHADGQYGTRNGAVRIDRLAHFLHEWVS